MPLTADQLLAKYKQSEEEYTFTIPGGETLRARRMGDANALIALERDAEKLAKVINDGRAHPDWKPYLPASSDIVRMALFADKLMIDPPIPFQMGLRMAKEAGPLFLQIVANLAPKAETDAVEAEVDAIEEAKNASGETDSAEPGSPSPETSMENTIST